MCILIAVFQEIPVSSPEPMMGSEAVEMEGGEEGAGVRSESEGSDYAPGRKKKKRSSSAKEKKKGGGAGGDREKGGGTSSSSKSKRKDPEPEEDEDDDDSQVQTEVQQTPKDSTYLSLHLNTTFSNGS